MFTIRMLLAVLLIASPLSSNACANPTEMEARELMQLLHEMDYALKKLRAAEANLQKAREATPAVREAIEAAEHEVAFASRYFSDASEKYREGKEKVEGARRARDSRTGVATTQHSSC
jgi:predicted  nucleic acid-binding Zn-ribbon protein